MDSSRASRWMSVTLFMVMLCASACTKIGVGTKNTLSGTGINSGDTAGTSGTGNFTLKSVVPSPGSGSTYDLIGRNEEFDTYCGGSYGTCACQYTYTQSGVGAQTQIGCVNYSESDLLRCVNAVPSGITSFDVQVVVQPTGTGNCAAAGTGGGTTIASSYTSNSLTVNLSGGVFAGSSAFLDLTNANSFVQAKKFQCRKNEFIPNPADSSTIDPFQSSDPHLIYAFNYYTTNVADSLLQFHNNSTNQDWECTLTATQDRTLPWWSNPYVYSQSSCTSGFCLGDGQLMAPTNSLVSGKIPVTGLVASNGKRRSSFWLASQSYGVFQTPVQAAVAPSSYLSARYSVIGYGAKPIPNVGGGSSCPSIQLPPNSAWVKLWNFRATDLTAPSYVTTSSSLAAGGIGCNVQSTPTVLFPACLQSENEDPSQPKVPFEGNRNLSSVNNTTNMALRVNLLTSGNVNPCYGIDNRNWVAGTDAGAEKWNASPYLGVTATLPQVTSLPWNIYNQISTSVAMSVCTAFTAAANEDGLVRFLLTATGCPLATGSGTVYPPFGNTGHATNPIAVTASGTAISSATPMDSQTKITTTQLNGGTNYSDQMFVVTDASVNDNSMNSGTPSDYVPITYRSSSDCSGATNAGCTAPPVHWLINDHEVSSDPNAPNIYPLCVVQFYD